MGSSVKPACFTDEEWAIDTLIWESGHECSYCYEELHVADLVYSLQAVLLCPDSTGELQTFLYESEEPMVTKFFHEGCWEELWLRMSDMYGGNAAAAAAPRCSTCDGPVEWYQRTGLILCGEFRLSTRTPNGANTITLESFGEQARLCANCLCVLSKQNSLWKEPIWTTTKP